MNQELIGHKVKGTEIFQPKNLNITIEEFMEKIMNRRILSVKERGKWLFLELDGAQFLLIHLGMGGDLLTFSPGDTLPEKYKFKLHFMNGSGFTINFWWFGYIHLIDKKQLNTHKLTHALGLSPLDEAFTLEYFKQILNGRKSRVKSFLLNQKRVAEIGNVYVHDILFRAQLHPNRKMNTLTVQEVESLYFSMKKTLLKSIEKGGLIHERDFYGNKGRFSEEDFLVAYKTGKHCPLCATPIEKIKTGNTSSYICPTCQK